jgi:hypothetical protein
MREISREEQGLRGSKRRRHDKIKSRLKRTLEEWKN